MSTENNNDQNENKDLSCAWLALIELLWILVLFIVVWVVIDQIWKAIFG